MEKRGEKMDKKFTRLDEKSKYNSTKKEGGS